MPGFDLSKPVPKNIKEAMAQVDNWNAEFGYKYAVERECGAWVEQGVLQSTKADDCLDELTALNVGVVFTVKTDKKRQFKRAKLRLYVAAHERVVVQGEHYFENFSQTVGWGRLRQCCAQACEEGFVGCNQWDTCAAFLYAENEPGTVVLVKLSDELAAALNVTKYCWCVKAAYGLPSAPAQFMKFVRNILVNDCGATQSLHDEAVFVVRRGKKYVMICTWVDDFCVLYNCRTLYEETRDAYFAKVKGEEGELDFMLGVNFDVDVAQQRIKLRATTAIEKIAAKYGKPQRESKVPMLEEDAELSKMELPEENSVEWQDLREQASVYRSLVPSMLYLATTCRPDICFAIGILCRCLDNPSARHIEAMWILLSYLIGTEEYGVEYKHDPNTRGVHVVYSKLKDGLVSLSDSDWSSGKSISGYVIYLAGGPIFWASKKQPVTSLSTTEAEYYAASACGADTLAAMHFGEDLTGVKNYSTPIYCDNSGAVNVAKNFNSNKRAKHIDRRVNFLNDYTEAGDIKVVPISTKDNVADAMTKPLGKVLFLKHREALVKGG
jgi:hypothetical protein